MIDTHSFQKPRGSPACWGNLLLLLGCPRAAGDPRRRKEDHAASGALGCAPCRRMLEQPWGFVLGEVFTCLIQNVLSVTAFRVSPVRRVVECLGCLLLRLPHHSWEVIKRLKGFGILGNLTLEKKKKKSRNFHLIREKVPSQTFSSTNDKHSLNSTYKDHMLTQDISWY